MCKNPGQLQDGRTVACRNCSLCKQRAKDDWLGRNIAESKTAKYAYRLDLTYGRNSAGDVLHERAVILTYSDVQKFLKLLRRHGYSVRYFVTGEYGNERGRSHWHLILCTDKPLPQKAGWDQYGHWVDNAKDRKRFNWVRVDEDGNAVYVDGEPAYWWPHGFAFFEKVNQRSIQYVCTYVLKEMDSEGRQYHNAMSKKPPIGHAYFCHLAERMVDAGIAPQSPEYKFPGVTRRKKKGGREVIPFWLKGRPLEMFLDHYIATWAERKGEQPRPSSALVDGYEEFGRVVDEDHATEIRTAHITTEKLLAPIRPPRKEYDGSLWAPLMRKQEWWQSYFEGFGDEQEKERYEQDVEYWSEWYETYHECIQAGAEPGKDLRELADDAGRALANHHSFESVDDWLRFRKGGCQHSEISRDGPDYGQSRLDRLKTGYQAFHAKPDAGGAGPG